MSDLNDLFATLSRERALLLDGISGLSEATLDQTGVVGEWSIKNVLAHLTAWEMVVNDSLPTRLSTGQRPAAFDDINDDEDGWNAAQVAARATLSPMEQLREFARVRAALTQTLQTFGEVVVSARHPWPQWEGTLAEYIEQGIVDHEREHREHIFAAVMQLRAQ